MEHRARWLVPLGLVVAGTISWACTDDPDLSGSAGTESGDEAGPGGSEDPTMPTASTTGSTTTPPVTGEAMDVTPADVLESIALNVLVPNTAAFAGAAADLQTAVDAYAAAVAADPVAAGPELADAQEAWQTAMASWQRLEVMQIGPAAPSVSGIGGENVRDEIYSWPTTDTCTVDRKIVDESYAVDDFFVTELVFNYGLDALEYLLYVHDQNHTCGAAVQLDGPWTGLGFEEVERRRGAYAARVAAEIARQGGALASRWSPEGDNLATQLGNPGGDSPWESEMVALDDVFRAMFYIDLETKDAKLGLPLGLQDGCDAAPCPDLFESPYGSMSAAAVAENLRGLKEMVRGGPDAETGAGFDDLLATGGNAEIATDLLVAINDAIAVADGFGDPLQQAVVGDPSSVETMHTAVRNVTDVLKGPFVMALMLTVPSEGAGDAD